MPRMAKPWQIVLLLTACAAAPPRPVAKPVAVAPSPFAITDTAMGAITGTSRGTLEGLRGLLRGFEVRPVYDGGLEYHVYKDGEQLYYVIPADDGTVFNVHVTSAKYAFERRPWHAGEPFKGAAELTACECWGEQPVCYRQGEHVAVSFKRACAGLSEGDQHARAVLDGVAVQRLIWSPTAFGGGAVKAGEDGGGEGGVVGGTTDGSDDPPPPPENDD